MGPQVGYYVPADPDGGGPARARHRRPRRLLRRGQPVRRARPRPRLRLERDDGDLRQRRHLRRGPLQGQRSTTSTAASAKPMEKLVKTESWTPNAIDPTESGAQTLTAYRTVHGIVFARGKVARQEGRLRARSQHLLPRGRLGDRLLQLNEPGFVTGVSGFKKAVSQHQLPLQLVLRRRRTHRLRALGRRCPSGPRAPRPTSRFSAPASTTGRASSPPAARPPTTCRSPSTRRRSTRDYLVSWNNKQAPEWAAADDQYDYGPLFRSQLIANRVKAGIKGKARR